MKKVLLIFTALLSAVFVSCSSNSKSITPTSTEFTSGELAKYVEIVDQPSELTFAEKDGAIATQYIRLKVTLKMVKDGFKDVDARDINFTGLLSVAVINLVDENGTEVQDLSVKSEDLLKLKKLLTGNEGDTEEIIFEGEFYNHDDAPNWFKEASQFTPYLSGDISVENSSVPYDDIDEDSDEEYSFDSEDESSETDSQDWEALLDSYEQYVDKYISCMKKAAKGDMSALSEYPDLMEKAQEFSDKMSGAQGDMSASQWARYMKITNKMATAAQQMQ